MSVYSSTRIARGPLLFVSGQTPAGTDGATPVEAYEQVRVVLGKIAAELTAHGLTWESVVKLTYYLRRIEDLADLRQAVLDTIPEPRPAATLVEVTAFVVPDFLVEIDAVTDLGSAQ